MPRRALVPLVAVLCLVCWDFPDDAEAAKKCKAGAVAVKINKRKSCSKKLAPEAVKPGADPLRAILAEVLLGRSWIKPLARFEQKPPVTNAKKIDPKLPNRILRGQTTLSSAFADLAGRAPLGSARPFVGARIRSAAARPLPIDGGKSGAKGTYDPDTGRVTATGSYEAGDGVTVDAEFEGDVGNGKTAASDSENIDVTLDQTQKKKGVKVGRFGIGIKSVGKVDRCPSGSGLVKGELTQGGRYISQAGDSETITLIFESKIKAEGHVDETAALDTIDFSETEEITYASDTIASVVTIDRKGTIDARSGKVTISGTPSARAKLGNRKRSIFSIFEATPETVEKQETAYAKKWLEDTGDDVSKAATSDLLARFGRAEQNWRKENQCASALLAETPPAKVKRGDRGKIKATVRAFDGEGAAGRWTLSPSKVSVDPSSGSSSAGGLFESNYAVGEVKDKESVGVELRVTSKAGIATASWKSTAEKPVDESVYFDIELLSYEAAHVGSQTHAFCMSSGIQLEGDSTETLAQDPAFSPANKFFENPSTGELSGGVYAQIPGSRDSTLKACNLSVPGETKPPCTRHFEDSVDGLVGAAVTIPPSGDAKIEWQMPMPTIGGLNHGPEAECAITSMFEPRMTKIESTVPRETFLSPGLHRIERTVADNLSGQFKMSGSGKAVIDYRRVNADGSPYTGA